MYSVSDLHTRKLSPPSLHFSLHKSKSSMSKLCFVFYHPAAFLCLYISFFCGMLFMVTWLYVHFFLSVFRVIVQARSYVLFQNDVLFVFFVHSCE